MAAGGLLQIIRRFPTAPGEGSVAAYAVSLARELGGTILAMEAGGPPPACAAMSPQAGEGALSTWQRALAETTPSVVWVQEAAAIRPAMLLDLGERGIPYAIFLHDFTPTCPTHRLWHKTQEICSGPGKTGWKCAWCVTPAWRQWTQLPWRTVLFRHRPQDWRTALVRAEALVVPSRFARDYWISLGAPPERLLLAPPLTAAGEPSPTAVTATSRLVFDGSDSADGLEMLGAALDLVRDSVSMVFTGPFAADQQRVLRESIAARHHVGFEPNPGYEPGDAAIFPARWEPASPMAVLHAQSVGARVVATAVGALPEVLIHGVNGFLAGRDDPPALAEAIQEALEPRPAAWAQTLEHNLQQLAQSGLEHLRNLLELMRSGASEPALEAGHGAWLDQVARVGGGREEAGQRLISALRLLPLAGEPPPEDRIFAQRARALGRNRRVMLNHAIAFLRACGCRRIYHAAPGGRSASDAVNWLADWGLAAVAEDALPDSAFLDGEGPGVEPGLLRRRFPQARAWVAIGPSGVETQAWLED